MIISLFMPAQKCVFENIIWTKYSDYFQTVMPNLFILFHRHGHLTEVWQLLKTMLPEWQLPEPEPEKSVDVSCDQSKKDGLNSAAAVSVRNPFCVPVF